MRIARWLSAAMCIAKVVESVGAATGVNLGPLFRNCAPEFANCLEFRGSSQKG